MAKMELRESHAPPAPLVLEREAVRTFPVFTHVDLASGIGGFSIAAEAVGFTTIAFYEIDEAASIVIEYWWPQVKNHGDFTTITQNPHGHVDLLTAGVPCQPTSHAGLRRGTSDARWLWPAAIRAMRLFRPCDAVFENPPALLTLEGGRAFNGIVSELVALGYDLWWDIFPAAAFGAGHLRERLVLVATDAVHSGNIERTQAHGSNGRPRKGEQARAGRGTEIADANSLTYSQHRETRNGSRTSEEARKSGLPSGNVAGRCSPESADADSQRRQETREQRVLEGEPRPDDVRRQFTSSDSQSSAHGNDDQAQQHAGTVCDQDDKGYGESRQHVPGTRLQRHARNDAAADERRQYRFAPADLRGRVRPGDWWSEAVTGIPLLVHGLPNKLVEAISRCTGNAVVPQTLIPVLTAIYQRRINGRARR